MKERSVNYYTISPIVLCWCTVARHLSLGPSLNLLKEQQGAGQFFKLITPTSEGRTKRKPF